MDVHECLSSGNVLFVFNNSVSSKDIKVILSYNNYFLIVVALTRMSSIFMFESCTWLLLSMLKFTLSLGAT